MNALLSTTTRQMLAVFAIPGDIVNLPGEWEGLRFVVTSREVTWFEGAATVTLDVTDERGGFRSPVVLAGDVALPFWGRAA